MINTSPLAQQLAAYKVIPVMVVSSVEEALMMGKLLMKNHLPVAEITFRTEAAKAAVKALKAAYPDLCIGAGTILNPAQAVQAKEAGADFLVSPGFNIHTLRAAKDLDIPMIPGVNNPTAIEMALNEGINEVKFFPAEPSGGIVMLKALLGPYRELLIMPTGGIHQNNVNAYLAIDRVIACGLSWMVDPVLVSNGDWKTLEKRIIAIKKIVNDQ